MENNIESWKNIIENCPELISMMPHRLKTLEFVEPLLQNGTISLNAHCVGETLADVSDLKFKYGPFDYKLAERLLKNDYPRFMKYLKSTCGRMHGLKLAKPANGELELTENDMKEFLLLGNRFNRKFFMRDSWQWLSKNQRNTFLKVFLENWGILAIKWCLQNYCIPLHDATVFQYLWKTLTYQFDYALIESEWELPEISSEDIMRAAIEVKTYFALAGRAVV